MTSHHDAPEKANTIPSLVEHVAHLLPAQAPLHAFVHHNTLHSFESLPFERAVVEAGKILDTEAFMAESAFAQELANGRIQLVDIDRVLGREPQNDHRLPGGITVQEFKRLRLTHYFEVPPAGSLTWYLTDGGLTDDLHPCLSGEAAARYRRRCASRDLGDVLRKLWRQLSESAPLLPAERPAVRPRDQLIQLGQRDTDRLVHPLLMRFCAAYLDQGVSYWTMADQSQPLLTAFRRLYARPLGPPDRWMRGLIAELKLQTERALSAEQTIARMLEMMAVPSAETEAFVQATLLSLRGWAGMVYQVEMRPDRAPVEARPATLIDYLAIQLTLDWHAAKYMCKQAGLSSLREVRVAAIERAAPERANLPLAFELFVTAQLVGLLPEQLTDADALAQWYRAVGHFHNLERRRLLHLAYERRHRVETLDAYAAHIRRGPAQPERPAFQAIFCIDDREESTRRHLEEICPDVETLGYAGFYGVAMAYQGLDDIRPRPLCPVPVTPQHLIREAPLDKHEFEKHRQRLARRGKRRLATTVGSQTLLRGAVVSTLMGAASTIALIGRVVTPRLAAQIDHYFEHPPDDHPQTRLQLERSDDARDDCGRHIGYTTDEMTDIVADVLTTMGIAQRLAPLVLFVGHGSSSLNNPHEAAHDCGATGGGRGGPNARAFSAMANHPTVRANLAKRGITITDDVWFVGSYHNTCDDSMTYYDEDLVPETHVGVFAKAKQRMETTCQRDAHERCRRFEDTPLRLTDRRAMEAAETHAEDLAQPRPEYGHATNAICVVGRRSTTRGLFFDRRAFLVSYDPTLDSDASILSALLQSVGPVGAGINLEYYFSFIDPTGYGSGTKLPHNIVGLFGVMDGHASDLRTGLPWQMVEIHEPVRLLTIVEASVETLQRVLEGAPGLAALINNEWIQLVSHNVETDELSVWRAGAFHPYTPTQQDIIIVEDSREHYAGRRDHLPCAHVRSAMATGGAA